MTTIARYIIVEVSDKDTNSNAQPRWRIDDYHVRKSVRGILVKDGAIALLNVSKRGYHKLPGGGIEARETSEEAFKREVLEETGYQCEVKDENEENSVTLESRDKYKLFQISYVFYARVKGEPIARNYTDSELEEGFQLEWVPFDNIDEVLQEDNPSDYEGKFIRVRDRAIINFYKNLL